jgi:transcriptional regulator with XRE-family HTH domain
MAWQPVDMRAWRQRLGLTQTKAGDALGLTLREIQHYEGGTRTIRRTTELACWALEHGAEPGVFQPRSTTSL